VPKDNPGDIPERELHVLRFGALIVHKQKSLDELKGAIAGLFRILWK
jgi:hypothetical protein